SHISSIIVCYSSETLSNDKLLMEKVKLSAQERNMKRAKHLHNRCNFEYWQVHRHDKPSNHSSKKYHHERFDHCGQIFYSLINLFIIKIGNFFKHSIQCANSFTYIYHLHYHVWKNTTFFEWFSYWTSFGNRITDSEYCIFDDFIAGG